MGRRLPSMYLFNRKVKTQLTFSFSIVLAILIAVGLVGLNSLSKIQSELVDVFKYQIPALNYILQADRDLQQAAVAERTLLSELTTSQRQSVLNAYEENSKQTIDRVKLYAELKPSAEEREHIDQFFELNKVWQKQSISIIENATKLSTEELQKRIFKTETAFESMRDHLDTVQEIVLKIATQEFETAQDLYIKTKWFLASIMSIGAFIGLGLAFAISININRKLLNVSTSLSHSSQENDKSSNQLKNFAERVSASVTQQASAIQQTVSTLNEITSMVNSSVQSAEDASQKAVVSSQISEDGKKAVSTVRNNIDQIKTSFEELGVKTNANFERLSNIIEIINNIQEKATIINDIVFQTKLLSFNASVEAARAGNEGRGFSVVAEEVGALAFSSGVAAKEITEILSKSITEVGIIIKDSKRDIQNNIDINKSLIDEGVQTANQGEDILKEIVEHSLNVRDLMNNISQASKEQAEGVHNITIAMNEIDSASAENANIAHHTSEVASKLTAEAVKLRSSSSTLIRMIQGNLNTIQEMEEVEVGNANAEEISKLAKFKHNKEINQEVPSADDIGFRESA